MQLQLSHRFEKQGHKTAVVREAEQAHVLSRAPGFNLCAFMQRERNLPIHL